MLNVWMKALAYRVLLCMYSQTCINEPPLGMGSDQTGCYTQMLVLSRFSQKNNGKVKWLTERSRVCHNHKPQPALDTKRKRKMTKTYTRKTNKYMYEKHKDKLPLPQAR